VRALGGQLLPQQYYNAARGGVTDPLLRLTAPPTQGAYQHEWVYQTIERAGGQGGSSSPGGGTRREPAATRATLGHAAGAQALLAGPLPEAIWKMSKFEKVAPKVTQYMGKP
jgi:hypothetical protein